MHVVKTNKSKVPKIENCELKIVLKSQRKINRNSVVSSHNGTYCACKKLTRSLEENGQHKAKIGNGKIELQQS
ncbi:hypothetical protein MTP99_010812 [Tenebrio molitor]|nr:hypothetical protein MTP99_010812 [Tenebrio molitor]